MTAKEGSWGTLRVPLLTLLAARLGTVVEEPSNRGYHFSGAFELLQRSRALTVSVYPKTVVVSLGSRGDPLRFWELFVFLTGWVPGVTGIAVQGWELSQMELNRDHLLAEGVGPLWALSRPMPLAQAVTAMVKVYTKQELQKVRAEIRLSGDIATEVLLDDIKTMLEWSERLSR